MKYNEKGKKLILGLIGTSIVRYQDYGLAYTKYKHGTMQVDLYHIDENDNSQRKVLTAIIDQPAEAYDINQININSEEDAQTVYTVLSILSTFILPVPHHVYAYYRGYENGTHYYDINDISEGGEELDYTNMD